MMHAEDIILDCGNSSIKWARYDTLEHVAEIDVLALGDVIIQGARVCVCAVNQRCLQEVERVLSALNCQVQVFGRDIPVPDCGQYQSCGHDRLTAGIAAIQLAQADVVVVDAGTMLTVTAWRYDPTVACSAAFIGGLIAPGPQACLQAMHSAAPALPQVEFMPQPASLENTNVLQTDTVGSMHNAITAGWPAFANSLIAQVQEQSSGTKLYMSGGYACLLFKLSELSETQNAAYYRSLSILGLAEIIKSSP